jgi:hypothetical protein
MWALWLVVLCALCTMAYERDQQILICRLKMALRTFVEITEHEHDDPRVGSVIGFSRLLLKEDSR